MGLPGRVVRAIRSIYHGWSAEEDRRYHDLLFRAGGFDPFSFSYPGYITTRRFADLVAPHLAGVDSVLDLGCGTAEITCEIASRCPRVSFTGVDHSESGITRAREHASCRGVQNLSFVLADVERYSPEGRPGLVTMFDAFHHLIDPERFVARLRPVCDRFLLVEPRGDWKGAWRRDLDLDWMVGEFDKIRARIAHLTDHPVPPAPHPARASGPVTGEPVEARYSLDDFKGFFRGYGVEMRGTVAGLSTYPPGPYAPTSSRERFGRLGYQMIVEMDEALRASGLDLLAKHWVLYLAKDCRGSWPTLPSLPAPSEFPESVRGMHEVGYEDFAGPTEMACDEEYKAAVTVLNRSAGTWSSTGCRPVLVSYHWIDAGGRAVVFDGERTPLPGPLAPDEHRRIMFRVKAPPTPGRWRMAIDLVQESVTWFSEVGSPWLEVPIRVHSGQRRGWRPGG